MFNDRLLNLIKLGFTFSFKFQKVVRNSKITKMANNENIQNEQKWKRVTFHRANVVGDSKPSKSFN